VSPADIVMDRAFTIDGAPEVVWPWLLQLGKRRAGWYLPRRVERLLPGSRRAARTVDPAWLNLRVGDVIPDYGGRDETFEVAEIDPPASLVYRSRRNRTNVTWSITLTPAGGGGPRRTRVHLRLRMGPVRHKRLARTAGELLDLLTVAGMAAGLRERLAENAPAG
jgi:Polyketide cyclase / dehydrase and lipid transport